MPLPWRVAGWFLAGGGYTRIRTGEHGQDASQLINVAFKNMESPCESGGFFVGGEAGVQDGPFGGTPPKAKGSGRGGGFALFLHGN